MGRAIHFEIAAKIPARAVDFYQRAFGWDVNSWDGPGEYWLATTGPDTMPGINGAIMQGDNPQVVLTIDVKDLDMAAKTIVESGGKTLTEPSEVMNVGMFRYCEDTEGNKFGIMQAFTPLEQRQMSAMSAMEETS